MSSETPSVIAANVLSSVIGPLILKELKNRLYCRLSVSLTALHILTEWLLLELFTLFNLTKRTDQISFSFRFRLALLASISAIGSNYILVNNSIGLFQLSRFLCLCLRDDRHTKTGLSARVAIVAGWILFSFSDPDVDFFCLIVAIVASLCDGYYRFLVARWKELGVSVGDVRLSFMPWHYSMAIVAATMIDNTGEYSFAYAGLSVGHIVAILVTCACSAVASLSTLDGRALQVGGSITTVLVLVIGFVCFPVDWESSAQMGRAVLGIGLVLAGAIILLRVRTGGAKKSDPQKRRLENEL
jgi:hypothetical protein